jgi:hypothetical protein
MSVSALPPDYASVCAMGRYGRTAMVFWLMKDRRPGSGRRLYRRSFSLYSCSYATFSSLPIVRFPESSPRVDL